MLTYTEYLKEVSKDYAVSVHDYLYAHLYGFPPMYYDRNLFQYTIICMLTYTLLVISAIIGLSVSVHDYLYAHLYEDGNHYLIIRRMFQYTIICMLTYTKWNGTQ